MSRPSVAEAERLAERFRTSGWPEAMPLPDYCIDGEVGPDKIYTRTVSVWVGDYDEPTAVAFRDLRRGTAYIAAAVGAIVALSMGLSLFLVEPAASHEWYDADCCSQQDCAPIDASKIEERDGGFFVRLEPGDHPMVTRRSVERFFPYGSRSLRESKDLESHACVMPDFGHFIEEDASGVLCLYHAPRSF